MKAWRKKGFGYVWIGAYRVTRHYGGPEEGGWWCDRYELLSSIRAHKRKAEQVAQQLADKFNHYVYGDIGSVLGGAEVLVREEKYPGKYTTKERPYYC